MSADYREISKNGLWNNNPALVQLLGLCPLLAVTGSVVNALGLGLATMLVLTGSNIAVSLIRKTVSDAVRLPAFVMIIASFTTCTELLMKAFTYELYQILGIFIPLIVTNCAILGRADAFASKNSVLPSAFDGLMMGCGFAGVLLTIGAIREILGSGTLFANMHLLLGPAAENWTLTLVEDYSGLLVAILPPGAFIVTGFLIALKNVIDAELERREKARRAAPVVKGSKRVRTTGQIT
ncbi:MAG: electron transport complex subunit E [Gammaproteobacteria bacterium]|uniref:electron transport complex subunit E n=1 Tax=Pseudomaricurvus alcaniphilus TaxID=1166482 RepID=UPI00140D0359|nr:electron transport complex subunit E [Pseudomaricurvus alcaniphilus]MBR9909013.1 electron transport complex subunit E [Gammaproteobacteria bacterium]NHN38064.1 electron transport complex subunit E [Pseudomaricurvus alcaniphilus]